MSKFTQKLKDFFQKVKELFKKLWAWIKLHKVVSIATAAAIVVVAVGGGLLLGLSGKNGNDSSSSSSSTPSSPGPSEECTEHIWDDGLVVEEATCVKEGQKKYTCTVCEKTKTELTGYADHDYEETVKEASCFEDGYTLYECKNCDDEYTDNVTLAKGSHNTKDCVWEQASKTLETGSECIYVIVEKTECTVCGEEVTKEYKSHVAKYTRNVIEEANCKKDGTVAFVCVCEDPAYTETESYSEAIHDWDNGVTEGNVTTYTCSLCGDTKTAFSVKEEVSAVIPADVLAQENVAIELKNAAMTMDDTLREQLGEGEINLSAETKGKTEIADKIDAEYLDKIGQDTPIYDFSLTKDGNAVDFNGGMMKISIEYTLSEGEDPANIVIWYLNDQTGKVEPIYDVVYADGYVTFETSHFSYYTVVRLSPQEYCAKYGHDYRKVTVDPTCTEDGFTVNSCKKCGEVARSDFEEATGHDYQDTVVPAKCGEKGYTSHTCENCDASYKDTYVDALQHKYQTTIIEADCSQEGCTLQKCEFCGNEVKTDIEPVKDHSYESAVTAPTCLKDGYTTHTCSVCGDSYKDSETPATGHNFVGGACTVCGATGDMAENFYFNLVESVFTADTYYMSVEDFKVVTKAIKNGAVYESMVSEVVLMEAQIGIDENGYLVGYSVGDTTVSNIYYGEEEIGQTVKETVVFANGNIYMEMEGDIEGEEKYVYLIPQDSIIDMAIGQTPISMEYLESMLGMVNDFYETVYVETIQPIFSGFANQQGNPLNDALGSMIEYAYRMESNADSITFTADLNKVLEVYDAVTGKTMAELFDEIYGEGKFEAVYEYLTASLDKPLKEVLEDVSETAKEYGVTLSEVYDAVDACMAWYTGNEDFNLAKLIADAETKTICGLLDAAMGCPEGETGKETYLGYIDMVADTMREYTLVELAMSFTYGQETQPNPGVAPNPNAPENLSEGSEEEGDMTEMLEMVRGYLEGLLETYGDSFEFRFVTDLEGNMRFVEFSINEFVYEGEIKDSEKHDDYEEEEEDKNVKEMYLFLNGTFKLEWNVSKEKDFSDFIEKADAMYADFQKAEFVGKNIELEGTNYTFGETEDGVLYLVPEIELGDLDVEVNLNPDDLYVYVDFYYFKNGMGLIRMAEDCNGYTLYNIANVQYSYRTYFTFDESGNVVADIEKTLEDMNDYTVSVAIFYNAEKDEFQGMPESYNDEETLHIWEVADMEYSDVCGGECFVTMQCAVCNETYTETWKKEHDVREIATLNAGSADCLDGVTIKRYCAVCDETIWEGTLYEHYEYEICIDLDSVCLNTVAKFYRCACGEKHGSWGVEGDCIFDERWDDALGGWVYTCCITECGYSYTVSDNYVNYTNPCRQTYTRTYNFGVGNIYKIVRTYEWHDTVTTHESEGSNGITVYKEVCQNCDKLVYTEKYDSFGRWIYYYNHLGKNGWMYERVSDMDGCWFVYYNLDRNGNKKVYEDYTPSAEIKHAESWWDWHQLENSCTQYNLGWRYCEDCGEYEYEEYHAPNHDYYYDDEKDLWVCAVCDLENETGSDGYFVLEDLGDFRIGFYNKYSVPYEFHIVGNMADGQEIVLDDKVEYDCFYYYRDYHGDGRNYEGWYAHSGYVDLDESIYDAIENYGLESVSIVFAYYDGYSGPYDPNSGTYEGSWVEFTLTITEW